MASERTRAPRCPICRGLLPTADEGPERGPKFAPLCSLRCKRIDLATWLGEGYRVAGEPAGSDQSGEPPQQGDER